MEFVLLIKLLFLLAVANGAPVIAKNIFRSVADWPVDGGLFFVDGRPLLGRSKTWRGLACALPATAVAAALLGWDWHFGAGIAAAAMAGDMLSSFIKRRLGLPASSMALVLDQIPEALLPLLWYREELGLGVADIVVVSCGFFVAELVLSRLFYRWNWRDRPY